MLRTLFKMHMWSPCSGSHTDEYYYVEDRYCTLKMRFTKSVFANLTLEQGLMSSRGEGYCL